MKIFLIILSLMGLGLTIVPAFLVFGHIISFGTHTTLMVVGTLIWFVTAPIWMKKQDEV